MAVPLDVNQKVVVDSQSTEAMDSPEMETWKMVTGFYEQGKTARSKFDSDWDQRWEFYNDNQWDKTRSAYKSSPVMNIVRTTIQSELPVLTDAKPTFNVMPEEPTDYDFADMLSKATESWWDKQAMDHSVVEVLMDAMVTDYGLWKVQWDPDACEGAGEIIADVVNPKDFYVPYGARDVNKNCPWAVEEIVKTVGEVKRKFPDVADKITPDEDGKNEADREKSYGGKVTLVSPIDRDKGGTQNQMPTASGDSRKTCTLLQCWLDDDTTEEYTEENKDTGASEKKLKMKYPKGRMVIVLKNKKGVVLFDGENPNKHAMKPYVRVVDSLLPRSFCGEGEAKSLIHMQRILNKVLANVIDHLNLMSNPVWYRTTDSGVKADSLTNKFGLVISTAPNHINDVKREFPPALQPGVLDLVNQIMRFVETISGSSDVTQGRRPAGITAASAIDSLQEASQTRTRLKERNLQVSLGQLGRQVTGLMMQHYKEPRMFKITGKEGWPEYFEFYFEDTPEGTVANKRKYSAVEENGSVRYSPDLSYTQSAPSKGIFDIKVLSGTSLPFAKAKRADLALRLYESASPSGPALDKEGLLEALEWPNKEQVLKRQNEQAAAMQAAQPMGGPVA